MFKLYLRVNKYFLYYFYSLTASMFRKICKMREKTVNNILLGIFTGIFTTKYGIENEVVAKG